MLSFRDNFFFTKFSILFFVVTIFGYWGIDLNSEELYIAFSFFFLVIAIFVLARTSLLLFFLNTVNLKYSRLLLNLNRVRLLLESNSILLKNASSLRKKTISRLSQVNLFIFQELLPLLSLRLTLSTAYSGQFLALLAVKLNVFIFHNSRIRRLSGFFENSINFFPVVK